MNVKNDEEIDLLNILKILWYGKWKIFGITFIAALVGFYLSINEPDSYKVSTSIKEGKVSVFTQYKSLNDVLKESMSIQGQQLINTDIFQINASTILDLFIDEFNDYEEVITTLSNDAFIVQLIKDLDEDDKQKALIGFAKSFVIVPSILEEEKIWNLSYQWHDVEGGARLFKEALLLTLINVKSNLADDIENFASSIDMRIQRDLEIYNKNLDLLKINQKARINKRIQYLFEQSSIARGLDIDTNTLPSIVSLTESLGVEKAVDALDKVPFYLRGFKAIDKEISIIRSRTEKEQLLMSDGYLELNEKIALLENNLSSSHLRGFLQSIKNDSPNDWVEFNLAMADSASLKRPMLFYVGLYLLLGLLIGSIYLLISNFIRINISNNA